MPLPAGELVPHSHTNMQQQIQMKKTENKRILKRRATKVDNAENCISYSKKSVQKPKHIRDSNECEEGTCVLPTQKINV